MKIKYQKDIRILKLKDLESEIQERSLRKDRKFILKGNWKKFVKKVNRFQIFQVNGEWIRNNLTVTFGHGGHSLVHEFIPYNEIWIDNKHHLNCGCRKVKKNRRVSPEFFESTILHEITEFQLMKKGVKYWQAHHQALKAEIKLGLLSNPYSEN